MIKTTINAESVVRGMEKILDLTENFRPFFLVALGQPTDKRDWTIIGGTMKNFATRSDPKGKQWPALNKKYAEQKQKIWGNKPILVASGKLFESLVGNSNDNVRIMTNKKLIFGTTVSYFKYHQSSDPRSHLPRRQVLGWSQKQKDVLTKLLFQYIKDGTKIDAKKAFT